MATIAMVGMAKGSGMIAPDMATMLSFVFTDAPIDAGGAASMPGEAVAEKLQRRHRRRRHLDLRHASRLRDGSRRCARRPGVPIGQPLEEFPGGAFRPLPRSRPAGGARRRGADEVRRDRSHRRRVRRLRAKRIALSIGNSPLVKTALAGEDANWGRVVMAVGKAGEPADRDRLSIWFGEHRVAFEGERDPSYSEEAVSAYMKNADLRIRVDLGLGQGRATIWTCDLTAEYIAINADYRS